MPGILIWAIILTTIALCLYTVSIFQIRHQGIIKKGSLIALSLAWFCDFMGTVLFYLLSKSVHVTMYTHAPIFVFHVWFGYLVLILMLILVIWVIHQFRHIAKRPGHTIMNYALISWILWVIEYLTGMLVH